MPTQANISELKAAATGEAAEEKSASRAHKRLTTARADARIALREINSAVEAEKPTDREYYLGEAEARLALAIGAVRALRQKEGG